MLNFRHAILVAAIGAALGISGCTSAPSVNGESEVLAAIAKSDAGIDKLLEEGNAKEAIKRLGDVTKRYPDRKEPWARLAKVHFDNGNYANAIVAAEEALQRDPADRTVKSLRAVAGLRVAAASLNDLRGDIALRGDAKGDAAGLVKVMRDTLGEEVLVPTSAPKAAPQKPRPSKPAVPKVRPASDTGNPFGALK